MENFNSQKHFMLVKDNKVFSVVNLLPDVPDDVQIYPATAEDLINFTKEEYKFNPETKKLELDDQKVIETAWRRLRFKRDALLSNTDWTSVLDNNLSDEYREKMKIYRQNLRDFPSKITDPTDPNIVWPQNPLEI